MKYYNRVTREPKYKVRRRELRKRMTEPEKRLWFAINNRQLGVKFRRQFSIDHYIVDFYCPERELVIEVDGDDHFDLAMQSRDAIRDSHLKARGLSVFRFTNHEIMHNLIGVLSYLIAFLNHHKNSLNIVHF